MKAGNLSGMQLNHGGFQVATVTSLDNGFGFAKYQGDYVRFESETGYKIVAGKNLPQLGDDYAQAPQVGDGIVVLVKQMGSGWLATAWGQYSEFKAAELVIKRRIDALNAQPKPAPLTPPVMEAKVPQRLSALRRYPRVKVPKVPGVLPTNGPISLEVAMAGGYDLSGEGAVGAECTIAPAPKANVAAATGK